MMNNAIINIYIDANVLINYCTGKGLGKEVVDFTFNQIEKAFSYYSNDIEDNIQYQISQIKNCDAILTNNLKDFRIFKDVEKLLPEVHFLRTQLDK